MAGPEIYLQDYCITQRVARMKFIKVFTLFLRGSRLLAVQWRWIRFLLLE